MEEPRRLRNRRRVLSRSICSTRCRSMPLERPSSLRSRSFQSEPPRPRPSGRRRTLLQCRLPVESDGARAPHARPGTGEPHNLVPACPCPSASVARSTCVEVRSDGPGRGVAGWWRSWAAERRAGAGQLRRERAPRSSARVADRPRRASADARRAGARVGAFARTRYQECAPARRSSSGEASPST